MTITETNVVDGLKAATVKTSSPRYAGAIDLFRTELAAGTSHHAAAEKALNQAISGLGNDTNRLALARKAAGLSFSARAKTTVQNARTALPKRKPRQTQPSKKSTQHWSFADGAMIFMIIVFIGLGIGIFSLLAPVIFLTANESYGVGAGTAAGFLSFISMLLIFGGLGWLVLTIIRTNHGYDFEAKRLEREYGSSVPSSTSH